MNTIETVMTPAIGLAITLAILSKDYGQTFLHKLFDNAACARLTAFLITVIGIATKILLDELKAPDIYGSSFLAFNSAIAGVYIGVGWAEKKQTQEIPDNSKTVVIPSSRTTMFFEQSIIGDSAPKPTSEHHE